MPALASVVVPLACRVAGASATLRIALLPRADVNSRALIDDRGDEDSDSTVAPVQLLESHEYRYDWEVSGIPGATFVTDPEEIFQPDTNDGLKGRLRPGLATGMLRVVLRVANLTIGELELEVRSRKLSYRDEYRWMLHDIATQMSELVMQRFAASAALFELEPSKDAVTLYQRFEFLRSLLADEAIDVAFQQIRRRPHVAWEEEQELISTGRMLKASSHVVRSLSKPGGRVLWSRGPVSSLPAQILTLRTEATHDTAPNRFVRFALERWRQVVSDIQEALGTSDQVVRARGIRETGQVLAWIDGILHDELFKELGELTHFPADNQVLHRREGYRDVFRAYLEFELAARLSWRRDDAAYKGAQRDVAQLYEYWAFLQLAKIIAKLAGDSFDVSSVLELHEAGLTVGLRTGKCTVVQGVVERLGRSMRVEFCFNRTFKPPHGTWTMPMRPDYSLIIEPSPYEIARFEPVILHFDAKYRVNAIKELFGTDDEQALDEEESDQRAERLGAKRSDLLKMHAYRDAIRRSAGAYVLYPGDDVPANNPSYQEYHELLPGLGAFVLRPSATGDVAGAGALRDFIESILNHVAERFSRHERGRFWIEETLARYEVGTSKDLFAYGEPAPDTTVLLGYVKSHEHWNWICKRQTYNVRAQGRRGGVSLGADLLHSQLLLLYSKKIGLVRLARVVSRPEPASAEAMKAAGYPSPGGEYFCVQITDLTELRASISLSATDIEMFATALTGTVGKPVGSTWGKVLSAGGKY